MRIFTVCVALVISLAFLLFLNTSLQVSHLVFIGIKYKLALSLIEFKL